MAAGEFAHDQYGCFSWKTSAFAPIKRLFTPDITVAGLREWPPLVYDACKLARHGGVVQEPRAALKALGVDFTDTTPTAETNWCCGGLRQLPIEPDGRS